MIFLSDILNFLTEKKKHKMTSTTMNQCGITFHDIDAQMKEKTISKLIKKYVSNECTILKINMGDTCRMYFN